MIVSERLVIPAHTVEAQRRASDPAASAWVSANAGAGKTKVLIDRVVRLLLAGTAPERILCLTFTKAAAATMAIRVFDRLGRWVTLTDQALAAELAELEGRPPSRWEMRRARRLFAAAVETPGGLKIETIHAFCERLLHLVPFEANVPARFEVLDEARSAELVREATNAVLAVAALDGSDELRAALEIVSLDAVGNGLTDAVDAILCEAPRIAAQGGWEAALARLERTLGLHPGETSAAIERAMLEDGIPPARWPAVAAALGASRNKSDREAAQTLLTAATERDPAEKLALYRSLFFKVDGDPLAKVGTKALDPGLSDELALEQARLVLLDDRLKAARALERTRALFTLASAIVRRVEATKASLGALDFDDLIRKTLALLSRGDAGWVLYKLDRGIDHVLVDEAQDTNPEQWAILRAITEEFTAGRGARGEARRTLFAVGDPKQSIFGFQGAEPREFEATRRQWSTKIEGAALRFEDVRLTLSFRSAVAVLSAVDATFQVAEHYRGLSFEDDVIGTTHVSARPDAPGLVELWPIELPADAPEPDAWTLPVDAPERTAPPLVVAGRVARAVRAWTTTGDEAGRVWRAGDVLVLVRKRGPAFEAVIRALKDSGVPVAGQDRLDIGEHIAVLDLLAAARAALLPEDDLTLATVLKSPLIGLSDDDLVRIAARRGEAESLVDALRRHTGADAVARAALDSLETWRGLARAHGPFGFYATLLGPLRGREKLVARLGGEAADAIDAFLLQAHAAERAETPSIPTFLARFEGASHAVKRDLDSTQNEVRVMTVHGAKGLEAPIVILIDGCDVHGRPKPMLSVPDGAGGAIPVWSPGQKHESEVMRRASDVRRTRELEEHNRLLYVAMTRARDRLVIAPYTSANRGSPQEAWCEMVRRALVQAEGGLVRNEAPYGPIEVWEPGAVARVAPDRPTQVFPAALDLPDWLTAPVPPEPEPERPLRPSRALPAAGSGTRSEGGGAASDARRRGILIHALLERLPAHPAAARAEVGRAILEARAPRLARSVRDDILAGALDVISHPALGPLFGPGSRAEAPVAGRIRIGDAEYPVSGQIDRLAVLDDEVLIADFKSGRSPEPGGPTPPQVAVQLALYRALLRTVHPDRMVRAFVVWTSGPLVRELDGELDRALGALAEDSSAADA